MRASVQNAVGVRLRLSLPILPASLTRRKNDAHTNRMGLVDRSSISTSSNRRGWIIEFTARHLDSRTFRTRDMRCGCFTMDKAQLSKVQS